MPNTYEDLLRYSSLIPETVSDAANNPSDGGDAIDVGTLSRLTLNFSLSSFNIHNLAALETYIRDIQPLAKEYVRLVESVANRNTITKNEASLVVISYLNCFSIGNLRYNTHYIELSNISSRSIFSFTFLPLSLVYIENVPRSIDEFHIDRDRGVSERQVTCIGQYPLAGNDNAGILQINPSPYDDYICTDTVVGFEGWSIIEFIQRHRYFNDVKDILRCGFTLGYNDLVPTTNSRAHETQNFISSIRTEYQHYLTMVSEAIGRYGRSMPHSEIWLRVLEALIDRTPEHRHDFWYDTTFEGTDWTNVAIIPSLFAVKTATDTHRTEIYTSVSLLWRGYSVSRLRWTGSIFEASCSGRGLEHPEEFFPHNIRPTPPARPVTRTASGASIYTASIASDFGGVWSVPRSPMSRRGSGYIQPYSTQVPDIVPGVKDYLKKNKDKLLLGIEIECYYDTEDVLRTIHEKHSDYCIMKSDGSLSEGTGVEIVTIPAPPDVHKRSLMQLLEDTKGQLKAWNYETAGMHIHMNMGAFTELTLGKFIKFFYDDDNESFITAIAQRKFNNHCRKSNHITSSSKEEVFVHEREVKSYDTEKKQWLYSSYNFKVADKFKKDRGMLNLTKVPRHGDKPQTMEVRMFKSNLSKLSLLAKIEFLESLFIFINQTPYNKLGHKDFLSWLDKQNDYNYLKTFISKRSKTFDFKFSNPFRDMHKDDGTEIDDAGKGTEINIKARKVA